MYKIKRWSTIKSKGSRTERELFHMFWNAGCGALRVAGSGSTPMPAPDLIAGTKGKLYAIECKSGKTTRYITKDQIEELKNFSQVFGAIPLVAIRFNNKPWYFLDISDLRSTPKGYAISLALAQEKGRSFDQIK